MILDLKRIWEVMNTLSNRQEELGQELLKQLEN